MTEDKKFPVFMDVRIYERPHQRMVFELFYDIAPFTAENFRALCTGEKGVSPKTRKRLRYPNTFFQKVRKGGSYVKGGVFGWETRECVESTYGPHFPVLESNNLKHDKEGLLSMPIGDLEACRSHFLITLKADQSLDSWNLLQ
ncbi:peptidyl-prolyl cis-trans isomerase CYP95-like [Neltuma alba]|uniref:peptidyl-prolyl cis-trans isomerase CYP95-like n=1 Tax=Neltuma alba TaxID=207710 RepID=UPI0010A2CEC2|nr:peptidyl-prolyl cis-trans isomerase CYP95-like [Prosopis alba]